jgi:hypothetical protein
MRRLFPLLVIGYTQDRICKGGSIHSATYELIVRLCLAFCFPDIEEAKTLITCFRGERYISTDSTERYLTEWEFVCLNESEQQLASTLSRPTQRVAKAAGVRGEDFHIFPSRKEEVQEEAMRNRDQEYER